MKKVVKVKSWKMGVASKGKELYEWLIDKGYSVADASEISNKTTLLFSGSEDEITPEELTDDMTLVMIKESKIYISYLEKNIDMDNSDYFDFIMLSGSLSVITNNDAGCGDLKELYTEQVGYDNLCHAFTQYNEALEFALEHLKKLQHD